jgi:peptidylprolyl isomerase
MWTGLADWRAFVPSSTRGLPVIVSQLRRLAPVALIAGAALVLAGCGSGSDSNSSDKSSSSSTPSSSSSPSATVSADANGCIKADSGKASDAVKVTGDFGKTQKATYDEPLKTTDLERTVLTQGKGATTKKGDSVNALVSVYLGTGKSLGTQPLTILVGSNTIPALFEAGAACLPVGSRTVSTQKASDVYGAQGNEQAGIKADDTIIVVTDVLGVKKDLKPAAWTKDVPKVDLSGKTPKVTLPKTKPPAQLELKVLKKGTGAVVGKGDTVTLDYQGTSWNTRKVFDQSYGKSPASFATDQVVEGFGAALVGQKVGTRLIVSIPPKYAYGEKGSGQQLAGETLVFLIEIKATKATG